MMRFRPTTLFLAFAALCGSALAQDMAQVRKGYADMCRQQSVAIPAEHGGDSDLKGHPKLDAYCDCVGGPWAERAMKALNGAAPSSKEQFAKEEWATRTSCRKKVGAPPPPPIKPLS